MSSPTQKRLDDVMQEIRSSSYAREDSLVYGIGANKVEHDPDCDTTLDDILSAGLTHAWLLAVASNRPTDASTILDTFLQSKLQNSSPGNIWVILYQEAICAGAYDTLLTALSTSFASHHEDISRTVHTMMGASASLNKDPDLVATNLSILRTLGPPGISSLVKAIRCPQDAVRDEKLLIPLLEDKAFSPLERALMLQASWPVLQPMIIHKNSQISPLLEQLLEDGLTLNDHLLAAEKNRAQWFQCHQLLSKIHNDPQGKTNRQERTILQNAKTNNWFDPVGITILLELFPNDPVPTILKELAEWSPNNVSPLWAARLQKDALQAVSSTPDSTRSGLKM